MIVGLPCLLIKSLLFLHDDDNDHQHDHGQGEGFIENEMFAANVINQIGPSQIKNWPQVTVTSSFLLFFFCCLEAFDQHLNQMVGASFDPLWANNETFFEFKATVMKFDLKIKIEIPPSNYDRHC